MQCNIVQEQKLGKQHFMPPASQNINLRALPQGPSELSTIYNYNAGDVSHFPERGQLILRAV